MSTKNHRFKNLSERLKFSRSHTLLLVCVPVNDFHSIPSHLCTPIDCVVKDEPTYDAAHGKLQVAKHVRDDEVR